MCNRISKLIHEYSAWWIALPAFLVFLLFNILVLPDQASKAKAEYGNAGSPDLSFYYSAEDLYQMAGKYGEEGRKSYVRTRITFDLVWPLVYTLFLITGISWVGRQAFAQGSRWHKANLLPLPGIILDYLENASTSVVMIRYPAKTAVLDSIATVFTMMKWVIINLSFLILLIFVIAALLKPKIMNN